MSERNEASTEHDPDLSALYRQSDDLAPPASLDAAILGAAKQAAWRRRHRWMLPLSTAAVILLSVTLLMNTNEERDFRPEPADRATPTPSTQASAPLAPRMAAKRKPPPPADTAEPAVEEESYGIGGTNASTPLGTSIAQPPAETITEQAPTTRGITADTTQLSKGASAPTAGVTESSVQARAGSAGVLAFSDSFSSTLDSADQAETKKAIPAAKPAPKEKAIAQPNSEEIADMERGAEEVLEPKPWLEKIRKLLKDGKKEEAKKSLEAFKKRYPDYRIPDDLKSLEPGAGT